MSPSDRLSHVTVFLICLAVATGVAAYIFDNVEALRAATGGFTLLALVLLVLVCIIEFWRAITDRANGIRLVGDTVPGLVGMVATTIVFRTAGFDDGISGMVLLVFILRGGPDVVGDAIISACAQGLRVNPRVLYKRGDTA